jgi:crossover junction endodeoxyribonuclease RusA
MEEPATPYPFEVVVEGVPLSLQASHQSRARWIERVHNAALSRRIHTYELGLLDERVLAVTIFYFAAAPMGGDIDNIVKPIMDALKAVAYVDDRVVERVVAQKYEPAVAWDFLAPSEQLAVALDRDPPVVYIRVDDDLRWRTQNGNS